jgi:hypothetical protein
LSLTYLSLSFFGCLLKMKLSIAHFFILFVVFKEAYGQCSINTSQKGGSLYSGDAYSHFSVIRSLALTHLSAWNALSSNNCASYTINVDILNTETVGTLAGANKNLFVMTDSGRIPINWNSYVFDSFSQVIRFSICLKKYVVGERVVLQNLGQY